MDVKKVIKCMAYHGMIVLRGFAKMLYGACTACLIVLAVCGFQEIPAEDGYTAVCDFIGAVALMVIALSCMYLFGSTNKRGRFSAYK